MACVCVNVLTHTHTHTPRQSQSFFRGYGSSLPTSLTHVPPLGQRLRTLRTCCGYRYDRGAAPRHACLCRHTQARGAARFSRAVGGAPACAFDMLSQRPHITHACRAQATQFGRADFPGSRRGKPPSPAKPIPEPARLLPPARTLASERADNSSRGPRRRRQRPCRGVAALYVQ